MPKININGHNRDMTVDGIKERLGALLGMGGLT